MPSAIKNEYLEATFSDTISIYLLSLYLDVDYYDLRERDYPLLAPSALAERLRKVAELFPPTPDSNSQSSTSAVRDKALRSKHGSPKKSRSTHWYGIPVRVFPVTLIGTLLCFCRQPLALRSSAR